MCKVFAMNISFHSVHIEIRSNYHNKNCALKERLRELTKSNGQLKPYLRACGGETRDESLRDYWQAMTCDLWPATCVFHLPQTDLG